MYNTINLINYPQKYITVVSLIILISRSPKPSGVLYDTLCKLGDAATSLCNITILMKTLYMSLGTNLAIMIKSTVY